jgi:hypothetical protein
MKTRAYRTGVWTILFSLFTLLALGGYSSTSHAQSVAPHAGSGILVAHQLLAGTLRQRLGRVPRSALRKVGQRRA